MTIGTDSESSEFNKADFLEKVDFWSFFGPVWPPNAKLIFFGVGYGPTSNRIGFFVSEGTKNPKVENFSFDAS